MTDSSSFDRPPLLRLADHTGFTVASLEEALRFWIEGLGFELSHRGEMGGEFLAEVTGVAGAAVKAATVVGYGHRIELLEYTAPADRSAPTWRPCDNGHAHIAFTVDDLEAVLARVTPYGFRARGRPQSIPTGKRAGTRVVYVFGPDGLTIEFMQPPG